MEESEESAEETPLAPPKNKTKVYNLCAKKDMSVDGYFTLSEIFTHLHFVTCVFCNTP